MNNKNRTKFTSIETETETNEFKSYRKTFLITFFSVAFIVACIMLVTWFRIPIEMEKAKNASANEQLDYYLIDLLIGKNLYLLEKYPKNYGYNLKLGTLYAIKKDYKNAEREFRIAVDKSPYLSYRARYKLAILYIKMNKLAEAQKLMDEITDKPDKKLIRNKGIIYQDIGTKLYQQRRYPEAASKFEKSIFYLKRCDDKKEFKNVQLKLSDCYEAMADIFVEKGLIEEGTFYLEKADKLNEKPDINYKLSLLYMETDPHKSYDLLEDVRRDAPEMLDYYMYYDLLMKISESSEALGDVSGRDLYIIKAKRFQRYVSDNILYKNDVQTTISDIVTTYDKKSNRINVNLKVQLRNNSPFDIRNLFIEIIFKEKENKVKTYRKQLFSYENYFPIGHKTALISLSMDLNKKNLDKTIDTFDTDIYLYKKHKHRLLVEHLQVKKPAESLR